MMNDSGSYTHRIWQPTVEVTDKVIPHPGSLTHHLNNQQQQQQLYTKTSLKTSDVDVKHQHQLQQSEREFNLQSLNKEILKASQAFNNSPKPFNQQTSTTTTTTNIRCKSPIEAHHKEFNTRNSGDTSGGRAHTATVVEANKETNQRLASNIRQNNKQIHSDQILHHNLPPLAESSNQQQQQGKPEGEMASQKLVHNQYNSPIDLYSMNNIRKTIEAHTELIAPGIKGINFMKPEPPVNKQSEVYKLVMEEEQRSRSRQGPSRLSPISGQPLHIPSALADSQLQHEIDDSQHNYQRHLSATMISPASGMHQQHQEATVGQYSHSNQRPQHQSSFVSISTQNPNQISRELQNSCNEHQQQQQNQQARGVLPQQQQQQIPTCCECGQFIVGPFAKIQNRFVHPQCFNCTTCGTSLKNVGYFTVNEKLYCDIHAKQVANMMHKQFDYATAVERQQSAQTSLQQKHQHQQHQSTLSSGKHEQTAVERQQQSSSLTTSAPGSSASNATDLIGVRQECFSSSSPATISTMFADRSCASAGGAKSEVRWAPTSASKVRNSTLASSSFNSTSACTSTSLCANMASSSSSYQQQQQHQESQNSLQHQQRQQFSPIPTGQQHQQQQDQPILGVRGRGLLQDCSTTQGGRIPVCCHCKVQIQGPYILAGKTTWCKLCSQSNFNCSSCRRSLLDIGFIEDNSHKYYCEHCFEAYYAPICYKCNLRIKGDCLNALSKQWHPSCFVCGHCRRPFGNSSFYLEDNVPYCERDWNVLFTTKCYSCSYPIEAGDKWIEALERNYHSNCFRCTSCQVNLEGSTFYCKGGKPFCRLHAR